MAVLVLGAYGLIGRQIVLRLLADGREVIGLGRNVDTAARQEPCITWRRADIARLTRPGDWASLLEGVDVVVNAAGALQTGLKDDVNAVQNRAMRALYAAAAAAGVRRILQISAPGAEPDASTDFLRSKAVADEALRVSGLEFVILRPVLIIGASAYGGTALLRALAAFPLFTPLILPDARVRTVSTATVASAAAAAAAGEITSGSDLLLAEPGSHSLAEVVRAFRQWLGLPPALSLPLPTAVGALVGAVADLAGWLGWRSPLRSTALKVMRDGVSPDAPGDAASLAQTLASMPATPQDLWFARLWLLKPVIILGLSAFWIASGWIGFLRQEAASEILTDAGLAPMLALAAVLGGSVIDIALGAAVLFRPTTKAALLGMIATSLTYVTGAALVSPGLWLDPLGAMVKTVPLILLHLVALATLEDR